MEKVSIEPVSYTHLFEQFKAYLKKHNLKQNAFFLGCIQRAIAEDAEPKTTEEQ